MVSTWWYVPNLIGYARIITGLWSLVYAFDQSAHHKFFLLYAISYGLDAVDGVAARALKQTSRFGALLDMVTDRFCTAALLAVLAHLYPECHVYFLWLMVLDIVSHWAQMYSSMATGASSHKNIADEHPLLRFYYTFPYALFTVCLLNEACLLSFFMLKHEAAVVEAWYVSADLHFTLGSPFTNGFFLRNYLLAVASLAVLVPLCSGHYLPWISKLVAALHPSVFSVSVSVPRALLYVTFPVFALKQVFSVLQLVKAATRIVALDEAARRDVDTNVALSIKKQA